MRLRAREQPQHSTAARPAKGRPTPLIEDGWHPLGTALERLLGLPIDNLWITPVDGRIVGAPTHASRVTLRSTEEDRGIVLELHGALDFSGSPASSPGPLRRGHRPTTSSYLDATVAERLSVARARDLADAHPGGSLVRG